MEARRDPKKRRHVAEEQWSRFRAAGYKQGYFEAVRAALRRLVDWGPEPKRPHGSRRDRDLQIVTAEARPTSRGFQ